MAVASPRLFLALRLSFSLPPSLCLSLPFFTPPLPPPLYSPIVLIVLFVLPLALNPSHTQTFAYVYRRHTSVYTHLYTSAYMHMRTYTRARSASLDVFARSVYTILRSFLLLLLFIVPFLLPSRSLHSRATHVRVSRSENSSVGPE